MARLSLRNVDKIYRSGQEAVHAVRSFNLDIEDGEFIALLGPSGCGKTSTLRMIVGLEEITAGELYFDDQRANELPPQARNVAMAFESYALYPNFTVAENLAFPLQVLKLARAEIDDKIAQIAEILQIEPILEQYPGNLSGGQQQRVGLGRALIRDPAVFILDEVMSHVDSHLKFQMLYDLKKLHRALKTTTIYVTHDQMEALALADRVAVMSDAVLQQVGDRAALYHRPVNRFVADFIGEPPTNFFDAQFDSAAQCLRIDDSDMAFHLRPAHAAALAQRDSHTFHVGLRPQYIGTAPAAERESISADVEINEYLGENSILSLKNGQVRFRAMASPNFSTKKGDRLQLYYHPKDVMVFDKADERLVEM